MFLFKEVDLAVVVCISQRRWILGYVSLKGGGLQYWRNDVMTGRVLKQMGL
jgi:hypothetical protein